MNIFCFISIANDVDKKNQNDAFLDWFKKV